MKHDISRARLVGKQVGWWGVLLAVGCSNYSDDCENFSKCEPPTTSAGGAGGDTSSVGAGGTSGGTGQGGTGGAGGVGGEGSTSTGGAAGSSATGGSTGSGGQNSGSGATSGQSGSAGAAGSGPSCDASASPLEDGCVVDEDFGVFVSPKGSDETGEGTRERPYGTLGHAVELAVSEGKRVYACATEGVFEETLALNAEHEGLELFGALDCSDWTPNPALRAPVLAPEGSALVIEGVTEGVTVESFRFEAPDAELPGESSVAGFIQSSKNVTLRSVTLVAGDGADGANGVTEPVAFPAKSELDGHAGTATTPGAKVVVECAAGGTTEGGVGGTIDPSGGGPGMPNHEGPGGEAGLVGESCGSGGTGQDGADAPASPAGAGAQSHGTLGPSGWQPADGEPGTPGLPGQGGGGGAGAPTGGGGSGGGGGCGGVGGAQGQGGGASIALLLLDAPVTLLDAELVAGRAGRGGAGDGGQAGQKEFGFAGSFGPGACGGGAGGLGGDGGAGGGGAGGLSVGLAIQGEAPSLEETTLTPGTAGAGGLGGEPGVNDGIAGLAASQVVLEELLGQ